MISKNGYHKNPAYMSVGFYFLKILCNTNGMKSSITVIIPAYNEAGNIENTAQSILNGLNNLGFENFEILIFNDASTDDTGKISDDLALQNNRVKVIHNNPNRGIGYNYQKGIELARYDYIVMFPGDNVIAESSVQNLLAKTGEADIVLSYVANQKLRRFSRRIISRAFTILINFLFCLKVTYYNGSPIIKTSLLRIVPQTTSGFAYMAEILVQLIKSGHSYIEVATNMQPRAYGKSTALRPKNFYLVGKTILDLLWKVYFTNTINKLKNLS